MTDLWARYAADEIAPHNKSGTAATKHRLWKSRIEPVVGQTPIREVTGTDLSAVIRNALRFAPETGEVVGGKGAAGNLYRLLHHLFAKALEWRMRPLELGHPLDGIEQPRVRRRERLLSDDELAALLAELDRSELAEQPQVLQAIRLAALSGWRIGELLTLRWEHVRRDLGEARLPDTKTGFSARPLTASVLYVLDTVERRPGVPWVLPGIRDPRLPLEYFTVHKAFRRIAARAGLTGVTPHTLRHRFTTEVANTAPNIRTGMAVTGHKSAAAYLAYVHAEKAQAKVIADEVGAKLAKLGAVAPAPKVIEIQPRSPKRHRG
jgi:integrase